MALQVSIKKTFNNFILDVNLETNGDTLALLGASGCGKSLTLKCIAGIVTPDEGRIVLNDITLFDSEKKINLPPQKRQVGYLFQSYGLFPTMSVEQNIAAGLCAQKGSFSKEERKRKVMDMLGHFHLEDIRQQKPCQISGGQQQRTALARILIGNPQILMLDEPFSALDGFLRGEMERLLLLTLDEFHRDTIFVSHNMEEVYRICPKAAVYGHGKIHAQGSVKELYEWPKTVDTARLMGCQNMAEAECREEGRLFVPQWNLEVIVHSADSLKDVAAVGIKSHDIQVFPKENAHSARVNGENSKILLEGKVTRVVEEPLENTVYVMPEGGEKELCLKSPKESIWESGQRVSLHILPEKILPLRG